MRLSPFCIDQRVCIYVYLQTLFSTKVLPLSRKQIPVIVRQFTFVSCFFQEANGLELWLQFLDEAAGREEMWKLTAESEKVMEQIITAIRAPWEELFSVPLQVLQANKI